MERQKNTVMQDGERRKDNQLQAGTDDGLEHQQQTEALSVWM